MRNCVFIYSHKMTLNSYFHQLFLLIKCFFNLSCSLYGVLAHLSSWVGFSQPLQQCKQKSVATGLSELLRKSIKLAFD